MCKQTCKKKAMLLNALHCLSLPPPIAFMLSLVFFNLYPCASRRMKKAKTDFKEYMDAFEDELQSFLERVKGRAQARIDKAIKEAEEVS